MRRLAALGFPYDFPGHVLRAADPEAGEIVFVDFQQGLDGDGHAACLVRVDNGGLGPLAEATLGLALTASVTDDLGDLLQDALAVGRLEEIRLEFELGAPGSATRLDERQHVRFEHPDQSWADLLGLQFTGLVVTLNARNRAIEVNRDFLAGKQAVRWWQQVHERVLRHFGALSIYKTQKNGIWRRKSIFL